MNSVQTKRKERAWKNACPKRPSTVWGGVERGQWVSCGGMKIERELPGTRVGKQKMNSGGDGGRHTQGTREPEQINVPV